MFDDASNATLALLLKLLDIIKAIAQERERNYNRSNNREKTKKVHFGKMNLHKYKSMLKHGEQFQTIDVHKSDMAEISKYAKMLGAEYADIHIGEDNIVTLAVQPQYFSQLNKAIELIAKEKIKEETVVVKKGSQLISAENVDIVKETLRYNDIPTYSFVNKDGSCMNIVPKEYEGRYDAAVQSALKLKENIKAIDIVSFEQTASLSELDYSATFVTMDEAEYLHTNAKGLNIEFVRTENANEIAIKYPRENDAAVVELRNSWKECLSEKESYLVHVVDQTITINKDALLVKEDEQSYFTRVPNTAGQDFIRINKSDATLENDGKTIAYKLDYGSQYAIYDAQGQLKNERSGRELAASYITKSQIGSKDATVSHYYNDNVERIEIFNAEKNSLIRIGLESAEKVRSALAKEGISPASADEIIKEIYKQMPTEYKDKFSYTAEKVEIVYADVPNIGAIVAQAQLSQTVVGMTEITVDNNVSTGEKCCIVDANTNQYMVLPPMSRAELSEQLMEMGYDRLKANVIADEVRAAYSSEIVEKSELVMPTEYYFPKNNPELSNMSYITEEESITIIQKNGDEYKYAQVGKDASREDLEKAVVNGFGVKDSASVATVVQQIDSTGMLKASDKVNVSGIEVSKLTSDVVKFEQNGISITMPKNNIDAAKISETFNLSAPKAEKFAKSVSSSLEKSANSNGNLFNNIVKTAKEKFESVKNTKSEKAIEINIPKRER